MNTALFNKLITQPAAVSAAHLTDLEALASHFPYCQLLHFLQAKPHYDGLTGQAEEKVQEAAVYAISRYKLKKFLEIPALPASENTLLPPQTDTGQALTEDTLQANLPVNQKADAPLISGEPVTGKANETRAKEADPDIEAYNNRMKKQKQMEIIESFIKAEPRISSLNSVKKEIPSKDLSENSGKAPEGLISENLASIMLKQGKTDKAIEIYEKLIVKFPEKKSYFAEKIENLKKE